MMRRTFLGLLGLGAAGFGADRAGLVDVPGADRIPIARDDNSTGNATPSSTNYDVHWYKFQSPGFKGINWFNLGDLRIYFYDTHDMDKFGFKHELEDDDDQPWLVRDAPRFGGTVAVPFARAVRQQGGFPSRRFRLIAYSDDQFFLEKQGSVTFTVPDHITLE